MLSPLSRASPGVQQIPEGVEGWTSPEEWELLRSLAADASEGCIVEIGSFRGLSALALARGAADDVPVFAIDPQEEFVGVGGFHFGPEDREAFYRNVLEHDGAQKVRLVNLPSDVVAPGWRRPIALLFIDGDHSYEGARKDLDGFAPHLTDTAVVVFDDMHAPYTGPRQVVDEELAAGRFRLVEEIGKVAVLRRLRSRGRARRAS
jgi:predicted O-methyltransferase YrrM